jgi:hypothetical protein
VSGLLPQLPSIDATLGVKASLHYGKPTDPDGDPQVQKVTYSLYAKTGSMEMPSHATTASETELVLGKEPSLDMFKSWDAFLATVTEMKIQRRIGIAVLGSAITATLMKQSALTSMLKSKYAEKGLRVEGYIHFRFELSAAQVRKLFEGIRALVTSGRSILDLFGDVIKFFATGEAPAHVKTAFEQIADSLGGSLQEARARAQVGFSFAAGASAAIGAAKVRGHLSAGGMVSYEADVKNELAEKLPILKKAILQPGEAGKALDVQGSDLKALGISPDADKP